MLIQTNPYPGSWHIQCNIGVFAIIIMRDFIVGKEKIRINI